MRNSGDGIKSQESCSSQTAVQAEQTLFGGKHRKHRSLDIDFKKFEDLNVEINMITQKRTEYEFVAVQHCVTSALTNAALFKNDLG